MKKYSWIVALLLALAFTFVSCGTDPIEQEEEQEVTYTEVELGARNVWAGGKDQQQGWATGEGFQFLGVGDKLETAKDLGYKLEDFVKAKFLVIETVDGIKGGVQIIWGGTQGSDLGGWNSSRVSSDGGEVVGSALGATLEDGILKIDLSKLLANYAKYKAATEDVKLIIQYYTGKGVEDLVKSAKLLIPDQEEPYVPIKANGLTLAKNTFLWTGELKLDAAVEPEDATNQLIVWAIKSFLPLGGVPATDLLTIDDEDQGKFEASAAALAAKVNFKELDKDVFTVVDNVWPNYTIKETVSGGGGFSKDTIVAADAEFSAGTVVIVAFVKDGTYAADGTTVTDYTQEFTVTIGDPAALKIKVGAADQDVYYYDVEGGDFALSTDGKGLTYTTADINYQGNYVQFRVNLGAGKSLTDFAKVVFSFEGKSGDVNNKQLQLWASKNKLAGGQWNADADGIIISKQSGAQQYTTGKKDNLELVIGDGANNTWGTPGDGAVLAGDYAANVAAVTGNVVWLALYVGGGGNAAAEFVLSNIVIQP